MISTFDELLVSLKKYIYDENELNMIKRAYLRADELHSSIKQKRKSGEPYIIHPLNVANTLTTWHAPATTICAGLLHDTAEDIESYKISDIEREFGSRVATLVAGVTKIKDINLNKETENAINQRKLLNAIEDDIEVVLIKLADRLHNMQTLEYQTREKQIAKASETLNIFAKLADRLGMYDLKRELEDLSLRFLIPINFQKISDDLDNYTKEVLPIIEEMIRILEKKIIDINDSSKILVRSKNVYDLYQNYLEGNTINQMHDLLGIKIITDTEANCYRILGIAHSVFTSAQIFKDYISCPKDNMYRSIHSTVFGLNRLLVKLRIRTKEMEQQEALGIANLYKDPNCHELMKKVVHSNLSSFESIVKIKDAKFDDSELIKNLECELDSIFVRNENGQYLSLPVNSTPIDFLIRTNPNLTKDIVAAIVNGRVVTLDYRLRNNDIVRIITTKDFISSEELIKSSGTQYSKKVIRGLFDLKK